ncbi:MAG: aminoacetone oxidase family FAD-binding enzyme [Clostridiales bacterium]|nr:MAG: aminoacetone oxidase family FAD-binding enzyme [Clostridiales bacterium]
MEIAIIGAGAGGLAAALNACHHAHVTLYERNSRAGRKLLATGGGRCNLTNRETSLSHYHGHDINFTENIFRHFPPTKIEQIFADLGVETVVEDHGRVFPRAGQAAAVLDNLRLYLLHHGVNEICDCEIVKIVPQKRGFTLYSAKNERFSADKVIVAAGSLAAPNVGGSDKGYHLLESLGHTLIAPSEALVQLKCDSPVLKALSGQKFEGEATLIIDGASVRKETGEILFTDYGLSGLPILQLSTHAVRALNCGQKAAVSLDLAPEYFSDEFFRYLEKRQALRGDIALEDFFTGFCPKRIGQQLIKAAINTPLSRSSSSLNKKELELLSFLAKNWLFPITGSMGFKNAQAALGGIALKEFSFDTLESLLVPGLYACGEVLDITGDCGGFNLQWAWASGLFCGMNAVCTLDE